MVILKYTEKMVVIFKQKCYLQNIILHFYNLSLLFLGISTQYTWVSGVDGVERMTDGGFIGKWCTSMQM